jgi:Mitochondrial carrier protein
MEFWPEFLASSWGREFVAGGVGGMAGVLAGYPLDTLRIRLQQPSPDPARSINAVSGKRGSAKSAIGLLRGILRSEGPSALYRGMGAPLASITFQVCVFVLVILYNQLQLCKGLLSVSSIKESLVLLLWIFLDIVFLHIKVQNVIYKENESPSCCINNLM